LLVRCCRSSPTLRSSYLLPPGRRLPGHAPDRRSPMIRVLVAEDVRLLREALVLLLGHEDGIEVVASVGSGDQIVPAALHHRPDRSEEHTSELQSRFDLV